MASSSIPIGIPSSIHSSLISMPQTSFYDYADYSAISDSDQFSHLDYPSPYPPTPGSMPSSYHNMYPYGGGTSNGSPPKYGPPSPKAFKRSMSMSAAGPNIDFGNASPPTPAASSSGSNGGPPPLGGDRVFRQILSSIARIQTNLSQQHFSILDVVEKQGLIQDKLSLLEQQSGRTGDKVARVLENTDCIVDDVNSVRDRVDSHQTAADDSIQDTLDDQAERIDKLIQDVKAIKLSVEALQAMTRANTRGIAAFKIDEEEEEKSEKSRPPSRSKEGKQLMSAEIKEIVKAQVRSEMKSLKSSLMSELKELKKMYKAKDESNPRSPGFTPEALVKFEDADVTKHLLKYGFDSAWVGSMTESQKKRMLAGYLGQSYRDALTKPQPPADDASDNSDDDGSGSDSDASS
ncbi:hypothetical protein TWF970_006058 [Orbilia oligospora]|uniref:Uncharacterized protein n=1 Tax=Orbilia oligospora TaxID=2813651 RepID=A0A7C8V554_ORBOL|nr:hypothetical protein TWF970_006058 [Orbilia oligospora]